MPTKSSATPFALKVLLTSVGGAAGIAIVVMFFMPWVLVDANLAAPVGVFGKKVDRVTGSRVGTNVTNVFRDMVASVRGPSGSVRMSGFDIAKSERNEFVVLVGSLMVLMDEKSKDPRQVKLLYLLPVVGFLLGLLVACGRGIFVKLVGLLCVALGAFMCFKLATSPSVTDLAKIQLLWGVWTTAVLFIGMGAAGLLKK